jgi:glutathione-regulated potassium-efflux system ancillary protein KefG
LILFAHPAYERSRVQRRLAEAVRDLSGVTFHDLYEAYPEFDIDVRREQALLLAHRLVVFQHPLYWYSTPALLKEWQDLVLEHGWAYGRGGDALRGKWFMSVLSAGGPEASYARDAANRFAVRELLAPIEQTARLCGMSVLPPFAVHGTHRLTPAAIDRHAADYRRTIEALRDGRLDAGRVGHLARINADLDAWIGT